MTCAEIQADLSLYLYGELDFAAEELIESHLLECAFCQLALNREKEWHAAVNRHPQDVSPEWLAACRSSLFRAIKEEPTSAAHVLRKFQGWWRGLLDIRLTDKSFRLAAISSLLLLGFFAGRTFSSWSLPSGRASVNSAGLVQPSVTQVQAIEPESGNRVRIILQQVQQREISGSRDDDEVRALLVNAMRGSLDPGVRMDSVDMLAGQSSVEIRDALIQSIRNDPNAAVRVKAIESLRKLPGDVETRGVLEFALAHDRDPGVRAEAIDALVPSQGDFQVTPQLMETMTNVMHSAQADDYVRWRCAQIVNARPSSNDIY
jgi:hypothetical protein